MKKSISFVALLVPMISRAAPLPTSLATSLMQVPAKCEQSETQSGQTKVTEYPATLEFESRGDGVLTAKVQGPDSAYRGANMIAEVKNVETQRSLDGAQLMGTNLETVRLSNRITKYDVFTSVRMNRTQARLVKMFEYDDTGRWPKRSYKLVISCTPAVAIGSTDIAKLVEAVNAGL